MRCVGIQRDRFMLNGPYYLRLVLDQGYWPDTLMTAPSDEGVAARCRVGEEHGIQRCAQAPED